MDTTTAATADRACVACLRPLPGWDPHRMACALCQQRADHHLRELPDLYAQLGHGTIQSAWRAGHRGASAGSRPPTGWDPHTADLTGRSGTVLPTLTGWCADWADVRGAAPPEWPVGDLHQVDEACRWLRWHLDWACRQHPAVDEALDEVRDVHRAVRTAATGDCGERRVGVTCGCGEVLRITVSTPGATCGGCGVQRGREEVLALPLAARTAGSAAA